MPVALVDGTEIPAVSVVVRELRVVQFGIELTHVREELRVGPLALGSRALRIAIVDRPDLLGCRILLLLGPHGRRVRLVIPHGVAHERVHEHVGLVHVADHALAGGNGAREAMRERMSRLVFGNDRIDGAALTRVARRGIWP